MSTETNPIIGSLISIPLPIPGISLNYIPDSLIFIILIYFLSLNILKFKKEYLKKNT